MITKDLFRNILVNPANDGCTELLIVSGYATASMAHRHLQEIEAQVQLIYGMASIDGVSLVDNAMFRNRESQGRFNCHYRVERLPVHSKVYVWLAESKPVKAYVGSANYTQAGFFGAHQEEAMSEADPTEAFAYYNKILRGSLEIGHDDIEQRVTFFSQEERTERPKDCVNLPLATRTGEPGSRSGLNWGQRPGRHPDQAYIPIPTAIGQTSFFPPRATRFTVLTDDGFSFIAVVAQDNDKAIHTPDGNYILGQYFRDRLGARRGERLRGHHLLSYGRANVEFCKLDDETFLMDFSVQ